MSYQQDTKINATAPTARDSAMASLSTGSQPPEAPVLYDIQTDGCRFVTQDDWDLSQSRLNALALERAAALAQLHSLGVV